MSDLQLDPATTALVLVDLQRGIVAMPTAPHGAADVVRRAAALAQCARACGMLVVLVHVDTGPDGVLFPAVLADLQRPRLVMPPGASDIVAELGPEPGDVVVTKHQPNAFYATDLEVQLARRRIGTLVLGGISTNIGVEATARAAHERGYNQIFVHDAMTAREPDLHEHAVTRFFPTIGRVRSADEVLAALAPPR